MSPLSMHPLFRTWAVLALLPLAARADFNAASATNQLGLDLYQQLAVTQPKGNLILSPYLVANGLVLAYAGAGGVTHQEMAKVLHVPTDDAAVSAGFGALRHALDEIVSHSSGQITWNYANRLFAQAGYPFRAAYLDTLRNDYAAPLDPLDFRRTADASRRTINAWVADQTRKKIPELLPPGAVDEHTRLVIANAAYLKAPWETPFDKELTKDRPFHFTTRDSARIPTMQRVEYTGYARENGYTVISLDYTGRDLQCLIVLPDENRTTEDVARGLSPADFARWTKLGTRPLGQDISLFLPKFELRPPSLPLGAALRTLGMKTAFNEPAGSANFEGIAPRSPSDYLAVSEVVQQTYIAFDEEKTEAAAADGVVVLSSFAVHAKPMELHIDRPFLIAIQHRPSGTCLFFGRITDPR